MKNTNHINRRQFLMHSVAGATVINAVGSNESRAANDKVIMGVMGLGGRGTYLAQAFAARSDTEIAYLCDVDTRRIARAAKAVEAAQTRKPKQVQDFRRMLDDSGVDAIINATPDHWHAPGAIMACQAGKDVYVEKPMCHNAWEGQKMIEAARKYQRVVQVGMQTRSAPYMKDVVEYIRSGQLGDVLLVRVYNMMRHSKMRLGSVQPVPAALDYDMWCGPAPKLPYDPGRRWLNFEEYSCGPIAGDAIHQLDLARQMMGDPADPEKVSHSGGLKALRDGRNTPDTQLAAFEYANFTLQFEAALWMGYMKKTPVSVRDSDQFPSWPFSSTKIEVLGTDGFMYVGRHGGGWQAYNADGQLTHSAYGRQADREHQDNFLDCIRQRKQPNADVVEGHRSAMLCHLANAAYRVGNETLAYDAKSRSFPDTPKANVFLKRTYRKPWQIPDRV